MSCVMSGVSSDPLLNTLFFYKDFDYIGKVCTLCPPILSLAHICLDLV